VKIRDLMNKEMDRGLSSSGHHDAAVKMFITYVQSLPDGSGNEVWFCSLPVLGPRVCHTMGILSPFISVLCHSD